MQNALILINYEVEVAGRLLASSCEQFSDKLFSRPILWRYRRLSKAAQSLAETRGSQSICWANEWVEWTNPKVQIRNNMFFLLSSTLTNSTQTNTGSMRKEPGIWNGIPLNNIFGRQESQGWLSCSGASVPAVTFVIHLAVVFQDSLVSKCRCATASCFLLALLF